MLEQKQLERRIHVPKILDRLVKQLQDKGHSKKAAFAIATKSLQKSGNLKKNSNKPKKLPKLDEKEYLPKVTENGL